MINQSTNPAEWALLIYEVDDAKEHLQGLLEQMAQGKIDEMDYQVQLGHIYAHLNRAWNTRNKLGECSDEEREAFSAFPKDIKPYG